MRKKLLATFTAILFVILLIYPLSRKAFAQQSQDESRGEQKVSTVDQSTNSDHEVGSTKVMKYLASGLQFELPSLQFLSHESGKEQDGSSGRFRKSYQ